MNIPNLFALCINATVFGSVVGMLIYILKSTLLRRLSAGWQYYLWSVMIIKLILPKGPQSSISVFNRLTPAAAITEEQLLSIATRAGEVSPSAHTAFEIASYIWAAGVILVFAWLCLSFILLHRGIRRTSVLPSVRTNEIFCRCKALMGIKGKITLVVQNHVPTTALCGLIRPKIIITPDFENSRETHMEYSFIHELSHYKRRDIAVCYLLIILRCIHWFNPILWFLLSRVRRDTELATDEMTMLRLNPDSRSSYGMALINTIAQTGGGTLGIMGMADSGRDIKKRIKAIAVFKKPGFLQHISGLVTILFIACICLTSAVIAEPITDIIYNTMPKVEALIELNSYPIEVKPETEPDEPAAKNEAESIAPETAVPEKAAPVPLPATIDEAIALTGQTVYEGEGVANINNTAKLISYNSDSRVTYSFVIRPNSQGHIQLMIEENSPYDHAVGLDISNVKTPGYGRFYKLYSGSTEPFFIDGLDPNEEYIVTTDTYCPGYYGIEGRVLIY